MTKIVGLQRKNGNFDNDRGQKVEYDNIMLYFVSDGISGITGCSVGEVKIPYDKCEAMTSFVFKDLGGIINKNVQFNYIPDGKFPKLESITVLDDKPVK